jgi:hypothetical protein
MAVAMARGVPDRTPFMCQLALGHYMLHSGLDPIEIWHDSETFAQALLTLQQRYLMDGILVNLPGRDPQWRKEVSSIEDDPGGEGARRIRWRGGRFTVAPGDDNPHVYVDEDQRWHPSFEEIEPEELYYVEPHAPAGITHPFTWGSGGEPAVPGSVAFFPPWQDSTLRKLRELVGDVISIHAEIFSPLSQLVELLDVTEGLMALALDPAKVRDILARLTEGAVTLGCLYAEAGCDALLISSAYAGGGLISREQYATFEQGGVRGVVRGVKSRHPKLPIYLHTCGAIGDRLDLMVETGVDGIDTFDPPPLGTVDLAEAVRILDRHCFIKGNVDPVNVVLKGTPEDCRAAATRCLEVAGAGGAYILSTACSVPPHAPPENILALASAIEDGAPDG